MEDLSKYNAEGTTLRRAQLRMLDILVEVDKICRKHSIDYWLDFGTLLGAVRHKGFIPWDDDIDISVMHKDYAHLREVLIAELPAQFVFQDTKTDPNAFFTYGRIRDTKSYCYYPHFTQLKEQGLPLDIFIYDEIPSLRFKKAVDFLYRRTYHEIHHYGDVAYTHKLEKLLKRTIAYILHPVSLLGVSLVRFFGKYNKNGELSRFASPHVTYHKKNIFPLIEIDFEGYKFLAPHDVDAHLKDIFGDYMQIPPEEKREHVFDMNKVKFFDE